MDKLTELKAKYGEVSYKLKAMISQVQAVEREQLGVEKELTMELQKQNGKIPEEIKEKVK